MSYALSDSNGDDRAGKGKSRPVLNNVVSTPVAARHRMSITRGYSLTFLAATGFSWRFAQGLETLKAVIRAPGKREASSHPPYSGSAPP
jgi:hypothetical protein